MKYIVAGTNRAKSRTLEISKYIQRIYSDLGEKVEIIDIAELPFSEIANVDYGQPLPTAFQKAADKILNSDGLIMVVPEYNGSLPGALKYFIDHWKYPDAFEHRPVCFIGLGGMFGGLRPVEHLQQIFSYRNAFMFPNRVFLMNVGKNLKDGELQDEATQKLLRTQAEQFILFVKALKSEKLDSVSRFKK